MDVLVGILVGVPVLIFPCWALEPSGESAETGEAVWVLCFRALALAMPSSIRSRRLTMLSLELLSHRLCQRTWQTTPPPHKGGRLVGYLYLLCLLLPASDPVNSTVETMV